MIRFVSSYFLVFSCLTHLLCCGIPFILSITSIAGNIGLYSISFFNFEWFEEIEIFIYIFSTTVLFFLIFSEFRIRKLDCSDNGDCCEPPCDPKKESIRKNIYFSTMIYIINCIVFFSEGLII